MNKLKKEISRFIITGCSGVAVDYLVYNLLLHVMDSTASKAISFVSGSVLAYIFNKFWTFQKNGQPSYKEIIKFIILYSSTLVVNVTVNKIVLMMVPTWVILGFLMATGTSTVLNFIGQKWWVFKNNEAKHSNSLLQ